MKNIPLIILILTFQSCSNKYSIEIETKINKKDSTLLMIYKNHTEKNFIIDFIPEIDDSEFELFPEGGSTFSIEMKAINFYKEDSVFYKNNKLIYINSFPNNLLYKYPITIKNKSTKVYQFKILNYRSGRKLKFFSSENPYNSYYIDMENLKSSKFLDTLNFVKSQKYKNFEYFSSYFHYKNNEILLP